jgi:ABC-type Fe3+-hydroxamate transport system substrate-binding protein
VHPLTAAGATPAALELVLEAPLYAALPAVTAGQVYGLATVVTDYAAARASLLEYEEKVLSAS